MWVNPHQLLVVAGSSGDGGNEAPRCAVIGGFINLHQNAASCIRDAECASPSGTVAAECNSRIGVHGDTGREWKLTYRPGDSGI